MKVEHTNGKSDLVALVSCILGSLKFVKESEENKISVADNKHPHI